MPGSEERLEAAPPVGAQIVTALSDLLDLSGPLLMTYGALSRLPPGHGFDLERLVDSKWYQLVSKSSPGNGPAPGTLDKVSFNQRLQTIVAWSPRSGVGVARDLAGVVDFGLPIWPRSADRGLYMFHIVDAPIAVTRAPSRQLHFCVVRRVKEPGGFPAKDQ